MNNEKDIYFETEYGKLYEKVEDGKFQIFEYKDENGKITNRFLKRQIPIQLGDESIYYDLVTPYGYGGPIIEECNGNKENLLKNYEENFQEYCKDNDIVSEFVRFHPIIGNALDFEKMYNSIYMRKTLVTNLKDYEDPVQSQFSKSARKNIRQAINKGVSFRVTKAPDNISVFKSIYYSTMDRNNATDYYFFDDEYFNKILKNFKENVVFVEAIFENKTIAAGLYFVYDKVIHIHLSGTLTEYLYLSPAYVLRYAITLWGKENGYKIIHHGGGRTNSEEDSLYTFKRNFAKLEDRDFYIGKKIWNDELYEKLCEIKNVDKNEAFFPAYRKEKS